MKAKEQVHLLRRVKEGLDEITPIFNKHNYNESIKTIDALVTDIIQLIRQLKVKAFDEEGL